MLHFFENLFRCLHESFVRHDKVLCRIELHFVDFFFRFAGEHVEPLDFCDFVKVEFDSVRCVGFHVRRENLDYVASHSEISPFQNHVVPLILNLAHFQLEFSYVEDFAFFDVDAHFLVQVRHSESVYARYCRNDNHVAPFHERVRRLEPESVYLLVRGCVFFDVEVA